MFTIAEPIMFTASVQYKLLGKFCGECHEISKIIIDYVKTRQVSETNILGIFNVIHKYIPEDICDTLRAEVLLQLTGKAKSKKFKKQSHLLRLDQITVRKFSNGTLIYVKQSNKMYKILISISKNKSECIIGIPGTLLEDYSDALAIVKHMQHIFSNLGIECSISDPVCTLKNYRSSIYPHFTDKETLKNILLKRGLNGYNISNIESNKELIITLSLENNIYRKIRIYNKCIIFYSYSGDVARDISKKFDMLFKEIESDEKNTEIVIDYIDNPQCVFDDIVDSANDSDDFDF
jgi:hypothetical protein